MGNKCVTGAEDPFQPMVLNCPSEEYLGDGTKKPVSMYKKE